MAHERVQWVDVARGIGILLVVYGHTLALPINKLFIYGFHVPLFFFLSGLFFRPGPLWQQVKHSFKTLLIPYFIFAITTYAFSRLSARPDTVSWAHAWYQLKGILYANGNNDGLGFNVVLWFLPCLFITQIVFGAIYNFCHSGLSKILPKTNVLMTIFLFLFSLVGFWLATWHNNLKLPYMSEVAPTGLVFFGAGYFFATFQEQIVPVLRKYAINLGLVFLFTYLTFAWWNFQIYHQTVDMFMNHFNNYFLFYLAAFLGILTCICLSILIEKAKVLAYLGRNSLILLGWHLALFGYLYQVVVSLLPGQLFIIFGELGRGLLGTIIVTSFVLFMNYLWQHNKTYLLSKS